MDFCPFFLVVDDGEQQGTRQYSQLHVRPSDALISHRGSVQGDNESQWRMTESSLSCGEIQLFSQPLSALAHVKQETRSEISRDPAAPTLQRTVTAGEKRSVGNT